MSNPTSIVFCSMRSFGDKQGYGNFQAQHVDQAIKWAESMVGIDEKAVKYEFTFEHGGLRFQTESIEKNQVANRIQDAEFISHWTVIGAVK